MSTQLVETEEKQSTSPAVRQRYTDEQKADALLTLALNGGNLTQTANELNIPVSNIYAWSIGRGVKPDVVQRVEVKKEDTAKEYDHIVRLVAKLGLEKAADAKFRDLMVGGGIAKDIAAHLRGEPTQVVEHRVVIAAYKGLIENFNRTPEEAKQIVAERLELPPAQVEKELERLENSA